ncbi:unnamed protein product [Porites evermanni]|uniref:Uncharacterized protein n=1 Tax=Porites evermanni TaxID=104178 RepID=A0ABN8SC34_9CNID|nr:unnamed protein product [Porites evermanni]
MKICCAFFRSSWLLTIEEKKKMSLLDRYPCDNTTAPTYLSFSTASCSSLIAFIASVRNFLVILSVILNPCKDLRSPFSYFEANLSFADLVSPESVPRRYAACRFFKSPAPLQP